jgi:pimeloyl-ACP methyl ester carboxylesterase
MVALPPSRWADLDGPVHYVDFGGPDDGPLLVCVHGLGGSHANWAAVAPVLARTCRVVALDLAGFGLTRGGARSTSVTANQELLHRFLTEVVGAPAVLVGNSMGGLIASLEASRHPQTVAGAVLIDPALPLGGRPDPVTVAMFTGFFLPGIGPAMLSGRARVRTPEQLAMATFQLCCVDPSRVPGEALKAHIALAEARGGYPQMQREFLVAARSLLWELAHRFRHAAMLRRISSPVLLLHGEKDRLVPIGAARTAARANPGWRFEIATDVGHVPQLEAPDWTVEQILDWLTHEGCDAARRAAGAVLPGRPVAAPGSAHCDGIAT